MGLTARPIAQCQDHLLRLIKKKSQDWPTRHQTDRSHLESIVRQVYHSHLKELEFMLAVASERRVVKFVAAEGDVEAGTG